MIHRTVYFLGPSVKNPTPPGMIPCPFFVTPHAIDAFQKRVANLRETEVIRIVQEQLQRRRLVVEESGNKPDTAIYACAYDDGTLHHRFYPVVTNAPDGEGEWPSVSTILGVDSPVHQKLVGDKRTVRIKGGARIQCQPTLMRELAPYWIRYTSPEFQQTLRPLRITIEVSGPMAGYNDPTLDGILARLVTDEAFEGGALDGDFAPYLLPVPLYRLWTDPVTGLPLWASNHFAPGGESLQAESYWHKRMIRTEMVRQRPGQPQPYAIKGRYKEKRVPMPVKAAGCWEVDCIGDPEEIARLLRSLDAIGKKRMALVLGFDVQQIDQFTLKRPVPVHYFDDPTAVTNKQYVGWTPPYWPGAPECHAECGYYAKPLGE